MHTDTDQRIAQFENMAQADPTNDMAHFSLGAAYMQAGRFDDAARAYLKCVEVNPDMSKARQMAAEALHKAGQDTRAAEVATEGYIQAALRGDLMPRNAMAEVLAHLGKPLPAVPESGKKKPSPGAPRTGSFVCKRTGRPGTQLDRPPCKGPVGQWIHANISAETWKDWIGQGTKVINELRLDLSRDEDGVVFDQHMRDFLGIDESLHKDIMESAR